MTNHRPKVLPPSLDIRSVKVWLQNIVSFLVALFVVVPLLVSDGLNEAEVLTPLVQLDPSIPTPSDAIGVMIGERHWYHHEILGYLDRLAGTSPRMVPLGEHARSHGGRSLVAYAISSPANLAWLEQIRAARQGVLDPEARDDSFNMPAVLHMGYSIHGNEPSGANSTPLLAYYLTAGRAPALNEQLENVLILLNPTFNPDGLDRFAHWTNNHRGAVPSGDPGDREHRELFYTGRTSYYWFDLNRDWMPHQHPESQGRVKFFHEWLPNVQLDFHEMGSSSTFFFMPGVPERTNPLTPQVNQELTNAIADYHRREFDSDGTLYYSQEGFDDFYVGKGSTYPDLFGCVGILFEQGSSRGAFQETDNGVLTFSRTILNQFRMSLSSIAATADLKDELQQYQREAFEESLEQGRAKGGHYLATAGGDRTRLREFVRVLQGHQIEVELLDAPAELEGIEYSAHNSIAIPLAQHRYTYLQSLWERRTTFEENIFYDVSAWTLPLAFNLQHTQGPVQGVSTAPLPESFVSPDSSDELSESAVGYLIDWRDSASPSLVHTLLKADANVRAATRPFTATLEDDETRAFGFGTIFVSKALDAKIPDEAVQLLKDGVTRGIPIYAVASSATPEGIDLGSRDFKVLEEPKVILVTGPGMSQYRTGEIWHLFDRRLRMPITMVDWTRLGGVDLREYTHVILVRGLSSLSDGGVDNLRRFVEGGGVLWAQGNSAVKWVVNWKLAQAKWRDAEAEPGEAARTVANLPNEDNANAEPTKDVTQSSNKPAERKAFIDARDNAAFKQISGAIFATSLDISHPIGYGYESEFLPVFRSSNDILEPSENAYSTPVYYSEKPLLAGYVSDENLQLLSDSASLIIDQRGSGAVVLALDTPCFRAFWWGTQRLLVNAIFFGQLLEEP